MKIILLALAVVLSTASFAQTKQPKPNARELNWKIVCSDHADIVDFLSEYEERPVVTGRMGPKGRMAFLINTKTGTWTLLAYTDQGACIMAGGEDAEQIEPRNRD
jgi:hypothetical protein